MKIIVGLGNPTKKYEGTRHNAGFETIDTLADKYDIRVGSLEHKAMVGKGLIEGDKVILAKPQTYMNLSGDSVRELCDYYGIDPSSELIVISDDIELPVGGIRIRERGSAGGHNGLKSIIERLGTQDFIRVRVGVGGKPEKMDLADHVLGHFQANEMDDFHDSVRNAAEAAVMILDGKIGEAMNRFNRKSKSRDPEPEKPD
ncbi:MAG: aminoacyl-tRNA hydrolase [Lachnospiraceae bacterium]|nr:aminoacyl-tRNA hydrolase [Lachnospiraceae bacterium]